MTGIHDPCENDLIFYARLGPQSYIAIDPVVGMHYMIQGGEHLIVQVSLVCDGETIEETIYILCAGELGAIPAEMKHQIAAEFSEVYKRWV